MRVRGINTNHLERCGFNEKDIRKLKSAFRELFEDESALQTKIEQWVNIGVEGQAAEVCRFCQRSLRGAYGRHCELYRGTAPPEAQR